MALGKLSMNICKCNGDIARSISSALKEVTEKVSGRILSLFPFLTVVFMPCLSGINFPGYAKPPVLFLPLK